jgi:hypothetical protein
MNVGWCAVQQKKKTARGDIRAAVNKEKGKSRQKTRCVLFVSDVKYDLLTLIIDGTYQQ